LALDVVASWQSGQPNSALKNSAMKRVKLPILQRNARIVGANVAAAESLSR
jgi:hypothetical protein